MRKLVSGIFLFLVAMGISFLVNFPMESLVRYNLWKLEKKNQISVTYTDGKFYLGRAIMDNLEIIGAGQKVITFDKVDASFWPGDINVKATKDKGTLTARLGSAGKEVDVDNLNLTSRGTKYFKQIDINSGSFKYNDAQKTGSGKFTISLKESLDPMIQTDIQLDCETHVSPQEMTISLPRIEGENINGSGYVSVLLDKTNFYNSRLTGTLKLNVSGAPMAFKVSGNVGNPFVGPSFGPETRAGGFSKTYE